MDKTIAKLLKDKRSRADAEEATLNAEARERYIGVRIGLCGQGLMTLIDSFDLKDPIPPKVKKERNPDDEDDDQYEEEDEEEDEAEDSDDFDEDDMSSGEIKRIKKKNNVDQITDNYHEDENFFLKLMSGEYIEGRLGSQRTRQSRPGKENHHKSRRRRFPILNRNITNTFWIK